MLRHFFISGPRYSDIYIFFVISVFFFDRFK